MACGYSIPMFFGSRNHVRYFIFTKNVILARYGTTPIFDWALNWLKFWNFLLKATMACWYSIPMFFGPRNHMKYFIFTKNVILTWYMGPHPFLIERKIDRNSDFCCYMHICLQKGVEGWNCGCDLVLVYTTIFDL